MLEHFNTLGIIDCFKGDCLCLYSGGDIGEVEIASSLFEGNLSDIFDDGKLIVVDSDGKGFGGFDF